MHQRILIVADIEGSSGCFTPAHAAWKTPEWASACVSMTADVNAVVQALFAAGVTRVAVKDFHRTAFNLIPELLDPRAELRQGYQNGRSPGIGDAPGFDAALFLGMHAASGTGGFLAHTLTSRIAELVCNGAPLPEVALFASSLAPDNIAPVFFSGCPVACLQAAKSVPGIGVYPIAKSEDAFDAPKWRKGLAEAAVQALSNSTLPYRPSGPFDCFARMRDGERAAEKLARRWKFRREGDTLVFHEDSLESLYMQLIRAVYLTPAAEKLIGPALALFNLNGMSGLGYIRKLQKGPTKKLSLNKAESGTGI